MNKVLYDKKLNREILEIVYSRDIYRIPKILNSRYEIKGILAIGGIGIIYEAIDKHLFDKKVLIKSVKYNPIIFSHKNNKGLLNDIMITRRALDIEKAVLYHAWNRKVGSTAIILDDFKDISLDIYGPHKDEKTGKSFYLDKDKDNNGNLIYSTEPYIVINYFSGGTLTPEVMSKNHEPLAFVKNLLKTIATILWSFHREFNGYRFVYCDLKLENILYTRENRIVLIDMGSFAIIKDNRIIGKPSITPGYSAPELINNISIDDLNLAADIYSMGIIAFAMITGEKISVNQNNEANINYKLLEKYPAWRNFIIKSTEYFPEDRYLSIEDFLKILYLLPTEKYKPHNAISPSKPPFPYYKKFSNKSINGWNIGEKKNKGLFDLYNVAKKIGTSITYSAVMITVSDSRLKEIYKDNFLKIKMQKSFLNNRLRDFVMILVKNYTFLPEILDEGEWKGNRFIIFVYPSGRMNIGNLKKDKLYIKEFTIINFFKQIIYLLLSISKSNLMLQKLEVTDFLRDQSNQLYLVNFLSMFHTKNVDFLNNPLSRDVILDIYTAPELYNAEDYNDKTLSYILGKMILSFMLGDKKFKNFFKNSPFPKKAVYEPIVNNLPVSSALKQLLLNLLPVSPTQRASLYDTLIAIKNRSNFINKEITFNYGNSSKNNKPKKFIKPVEKDRGRNLKISIVNKISKKYFIDYVSIFNEVSISNNRSFYFKKQHSIFKKEPSDFMLKKINARNESYSIINNNKLKMIFDDDLFLLTDRRRKKFNNILLIVDNELSDILSVINDYDDFFDMIFLFALENPFKLNNKIKYYDLNRFISKRGKDK